MRLFVEPYMGEEQFGFRKGNGTAMFFVTHGGDKVVIPTREPLGLTGLRGGKNNRENNREMIPPVLYDSTT